MRNAEGGIRGAQGRGCGDPEGTDGGWGCSGQAHTQQLCICSGQQLIEDVEVPFSFELLHHSGFLQQIWQKIRKECFADLGDTSASL